MTALANTSALIRPFGPDRQHVVAQLDAALHVALDGEILAAVQLTLDDDGFADVDHVTHRGARLVGALGHHRRALPWAPAAAPALEPLRPARTASPPHPVSTSFKPPLSRVFCSSSPPRERVFVLQGEPGPVSIWERRKRCLPVLVLGLRGDATLLEPDADLSRLQRHDAAGRGRRRGDDAGACATWSAMPRASTASGSRRRAPSTSPAGPVAALLGGEPVGGGLHGRGHRVRQSRHPRGRRGARGDRPARDRGQRDRARGRAADFPRARPARVDADGAARREQRRGLARGRARGRVGHDGARLGDAREQRGRHRAAGRGHRGHRARAWRPHAHRRGAVGGEDPAVGSRRSASIC